MKAEPVGHGPADANGEGDEEEVEDEEWRIESDVEADDSDSDDDDEPREDTPLPRPDDLLQLPDLGDDLLGELDEELLSDSECVESDVEDEEEDGSPGQKASQQQELRDLGLQGQDAGRQLVSRKNTGPQAGSSSLQRVPSGSGAGGGAQGPKPASVLTTVASVAPVGDEPECQSPPAAAMQPAEGAQALPAATAVEAPRQAVASTDLRQGVQAVPGTPEATHRPGTDGYGDPQQPGVPMPFSAEGSDMEGMAVESTWTAAAAHVHLPAADGGQHTHSDQALRGNTVPFSGGISKRTRAHVSLRNVDMSELEQRLPMHVDMEELELAEDDEEWQKFLQAVFNTEATLSEDGSDGSDDDPDFLADAGLDLGDATGGGWMQLLNSPEGDGEVAGGPAIQVPRTRAWRLRNGRGADDSESDDWDASSVSSGSSDDESQYAGHRSRRRRGPRYGMTREQLATLHAQVHCHCQLLTQSYVMLARDPDEQAQVLSTKTLKLIQLMDSTRVRHGIERQTAGLPPYTPIQLCGSGYSILPEAQAATEGAVAATTAGDTTGAAVEGAPGGAGMQVVGADQAAASAGAAPASEAGADDLDATASLFPQGSLPTGRLSGPARSAALTVAIRRFRPSWCPGPDGKAWSVLHVVPLRKFSEVQGCLLRLGPLPESGLAAQREILAANKSLRKTKRRKGFDPLSSTLRHVMPALNCLKGSLLRELMYSPGPSMPPSYWTEAEDELLVYGLQKYAMNWQKISSHLVVNRTPTQIANRKKNMHARAKQSEGAAAVDGGSQPAPDDGSSSMARLKSQPSKKASSSAPLTPEEIAIVRGALHMHPVDNVDAKRARRSWEFISRDFLPERSAKMLEKLWAEQHPAQEPAGGVAGAQAPGAAQPVGNAGQQQQQWGCGKAAPVAAAQAVPLAGAAPSTLQPNLLAIVQAARVLGISPAVAAAQILQAQQQAQQQARLVAALQHSLAYNNAPGAAANLAAQFPGQALPATAGSAGAEAAAAVVQLLGQLQQRQAAPEPQAVAAAVLRAAATAPTAPMQPVALAVASAAAPALQVPGTAPQVRHVTGPLAGAPVPLPLAIGAAAPGAPAVSSARLASDAATFRPSSTSPPATAFGLGGTVTLVQPAPATQAATGLASAVLGGVQAERPLSSAPPDLRAQPSASAAAAGPTDPRLAHWRAVAAAAAAAPGPPQPPQEEPALPMEEPAPQPGAEPDALPNMRSSASTLPATSENFTIGGLSDLFGSRSGAATPGCLSPNGYGHSILSHGNTMSLLLNSLLGTASRPGSPARSALNTAAPEGDASPPDAPHAAPVDDEAAGPGPARRGAGAGEQAGAPAGAAPGPAGPSTQEPGAMRSPLLSPPPGSRLARHLLSPTSPDSGRRGIRPPGHAPLSASLRTLQGGGDATPSSDPKGKRRSRIGAAAMAEAARMMQLTPVREGDVAPSPFEGTAQNDSQGKERARTSHLGSAGREAGPEPVAERPSGDENCEAEGEGVVRARKRLKLDVEGEVDAAAAAAQPPGGVGNGKSQQQERQQPGRVRQAPLRPFADVQEAAAGPAAAIAPSLQQAGQVAAEPAPSAGATVAGKAVPTPSASRSMGELPAGAGDGAGGNMIAAGVASAADGRLPNSLAAGDVPDKPSSTGQGAPAGSSKRQRQAGSGRAQKSEAAVPGAAPQGVPAAYAAQSKGKPSAPAEDTQGKAPARKRTRSGSAKAAEQPAPAGNGSAPAHVDAPDAACPAVAAAGPSAGLPPAAVPARPPPPPPLPPPASRAATGAAAVPSGAAGRPPKARTSSRAAADEALAPQLPSAPSVPAPRKPPTLPVAPTVQRAQPLQLVRPIPTGGGLGHAPEPAAVLSLLPGGADLTTNGLSLHSLLCGPDTLDGMMDIDSILPSISTRSLAAAAASSPLRAGAAAARIGPAAPVPVTATAATARGPFASVFGGGAAASGAPPSFTSPTNSQMLQVTPFAPNTHTLGTLDILPLFTNNSMDLWQAVHGSGAAGSRRPGAAPIVAGTTAGGADDGGHDAGATAGAVALLQNLHHSDTPIDPWTRFMTAMSPANSGPLRGSERSQSAFRPYSSGHAAGAHPRVAVATTTAAPAGNEGDGGHDEAQDMQGTGEERVLGMSGRADGHVDKGRKDGGGETHAGQVPNGAAVVAHAATGMACPGGAGGLKRDSAATADVSTHEGPAAKLTAGDPDCGHATISESHVAEGGPAADVNGQAFMQRGSGSQSLVPNAQACPSLQAASGAETSAGRAASAAQAPASAAGSDLPLGSAGSSGAAASSLAGRQPLHLHPSPRLPPTLATGGAARPAAGAETVMLFGRPVTKPLPHPGSAMPQLTLRSPPAAPTRSVPRAFPAEAALGPATTVAAEPSDRSKSRSQGQANACAPAGPAQDPQPAMLTPVFAPDAPRTAGGALPSLPPIVALTPACQAQAAGLDGLLPTPGVTPASGAAAADADTAVAVAVPLSLTPLLPGTVTAERAGRAVNGMALAHRARAGPARPSASHWASHEPGLDPMQQCTDAPADAEQPATSITFAPAAAGAACASTRCAGGAGGGGTDTPGNRTCFSHVQGRQDQRPQAGAATPGTAAPPQAAQEQPAAAVAPAAAEDAAGGGRRAGDAPGGTGEDSGDAVAWSREQDQLVLMEAFRRGDSPATWQAIWEALGRVQSVAAVEQRGRQLMARAMAMVL